VPPQTNGTTAPAHIQIRRHPQCRINAAIVGIFKDGGHPVITLSLISCYEYQSCEHPEWRTSEARAICEALRKLAIRNLPGYDEAPWHADTRDVFRKARREN